MPETKLSKSNLSATLDEMTDDLETIIKYIEKKIEKGDIETQIDINTLVNKIQYATYGAEPLSLIYASLKYISKFKDVALEIIHDEQQ